MKAETLLIVAALPFVLNLSLSQTEKRVAWQTGVHNIFLAKSVCGCQIRDTPCFLEMAQEDQDKLIPDDHALSFLNFCKIINRAQERVEEKLSHDFDSLPID